MDHLGDIEVGRVIYSFYGTFPDITSVVPSSGTVYSFTGYSFISGHGDPYPNMMSVDIEMYTSNGFIDYRGEVFY